MTLSLNFPVNDSSTELCCYMANEAQTRTQRPHFKQWATRVVGLYFMTPGCVIGKHAKTVHCRGQCKKNLANRYKICLSFCF